MTREYAIAAADQVAAYLKEVHGATRVVLFGSCRDGDFLEGHSDIDLYFEGIPYDRELSVVGQTLCQFSDLNLDLIAAGHAAEELKREILKPGGASLAPGERLQKDVERLSRTVGDLKLVYDLKLEGETPGRDQAQAVALVYRLSQFYAGLERCLTRKLRQAGIALPAKTPAYSKALLARAIEAKWIGSHQEAFLNDLLRFRDFADRSFGVDYRLDEIKDKAAKLHAMWPDLKTQLENTPPPLP